MIIERKEDGANLQLTQRELEWLQLALAKTPPDVTPEVPGIFIDTIVKYEPLDFDPAAVDAPDEEEPFL